MGWKSVVAAIGLATVLAPAAAQAESPEIRLYVMDCGRLSMSNADFYADDGAYKGVAKTMVVPCFLIRHPKGDLIWDTGVPESLADQPPKPGAESIVVTRKLTDQLRELGLAPADIEYLSISHSHFDHIGNAGLFAKSTWIVDPDERDYAFRPAARVDAKGFAAYSALEGAKTALVEGDKPYDVFGDGTVLVVPTPGHTPGHTVLLVRLRKAGPVLLTGDMWHVAESRAARRVPRFNVDRAKTLASMDRVEALAVKENARVVRQHVPEDFAALPTFPKPLE